MAVSGESILLNYRAGGDNVLFVKSLAVGRWPLAVGGECGLPGNGQNQATITGKAGSGSLEAVRL